MLICWVSRVTPVFVLNSVCHRGIACAHLLGFPGHSCVLNRVCHRGIARAHLLGFPGHSCVCFKSCVS